MSDRDAKKAGHDDARTPRGAKQSPGAPLRYVGGGAYIVGVPARDLTAEEAATHAARIAAAEAASGLALYAPFDEEGQEG